MRFFEQFDKTVQTIFKDVIAAQQTEIAIQIMLIANVSITLYVLWSGYKVLAGKSQAPVQDLIWDLGKFAIILMFINNTDGYLTAVMEAVKGMKAGFSGGASVWSSLDNLWESTQKLADAIYALDDSKYVPMSGWSGSMLVWLGSIIIMGFTSFVYITADIAMILLITTAPLFIFCLMFGFLRTMFNNWLQMIFSSILTVLFASFILSISMSYHGQILSQVTAKSDTSEVYMGALGLMVGIISAILVLTAKGFAQQIAGASAEGAVAGMAFAAGKLGWDTLKGKDKNNNNNNNENRGSNGVDSKDSTNKSVSSTQMQRIRQSQIERSRNS